MKIAKIIAFSGFISMSFALMYGFIVGNFFEEGRILANMPWGIVSLVDLYVGFILFSGWIVYREKSWKRSWYWVVLMMVLGFFTASIYTLLAIYKSKGNWDAFWLGNQVVHKDT